MKTFSVNTDDGPTKEIMWVQFAIDNGDGNYTWKVADTFKKNPATPDPVYAGPATKEELQQKVWDSAALKNIVAPGVVNTITDASYLFTDAATPTQWYKGADMPDWEFTSATTCNSFNRGNTSTVHGVLNAPNCTSVSYAFYGNTNLTDLSFKSEKSVENINYICQNDTKLQNVTIDAPNVWNAVNAFSTTSKSNALAGKTIYDVFPQLETNHKLFYKNDTTVYATSFANIFYNTSIEGPVGKGGAFDTETGENNFDITISKPIDASGTMSSNPSDWNEWSNRPTNWAWSFTNKNFGEPLYFGNLGVNTQRTTAGLYQAFVNANITSCHIRFYGQTSNTAAAYGTVKSCFTGNSKLKFATIINGYATTGRNNINGSFTECLHNCSSLQKSYNSNAAGQIFRQFGRANASSNVKEIYYTDNIIFDGSASTNNQALIKFKKLKKLIFTTKIITRLNDQYQYMNYTFNGDMALDLMSAQNLCLLISDEYITSAKTKADPMELPTVNTSDPNPPTQAAFGYDRTMVDEDGNQQIFPVADMAESDYTLVEDGVTYSFPSRDDGGLYAPKVGTKLFQAFKCLQEDKRLKVCPNYNVPICGMTLDNVKVLNNQLATGGSGTVTFGIAIHKSYNVLHDYLSTESDSTKNYQADIGIDFSTKGYYPIGELYDTLKAMHSKGYTLAITFED